MAPRVKRYHVNGVTYHATTRVEDMPMPMGKITPPAKPFITQSTPEVIERFDDANLRVDEIHWLAACSSDDYRELWSRLDIESPLMGRLTREALEVPDDVTEAEDFGEWVHMRGKYGWVVLGSSPTPMVSRLTAEGEPLVTISWSFYTNFVAYDVLLTDALEDLFRQVAEDREEIVAEQVRDLSDG